MFALIKTFLFANVVTLALFVDGDELELADNHSDAVYGLSLMQNSRTTMILGAGQLTEDPFGDLEDEFDERKVVLEPAPTFEESVQSVTSFGLQDREFWWVFCMDLVIFAVVVGVSRTIYARRSIAASLKANQGHIAATTSKAKVVNVTGSTVVDFGPLVQAAQSGNQETWRRLLEDTPSLATSEDACGCTALHVAAHCASVQIVQELLERGADVNAREAWEETPLHFAAKAGDVDVCQLLISFGAKLNAVNLSDCTPLMAAARADKEAVCTFLLDRGAECGADDVDVPPVLSSLLLARIIRGPEEMSA